MYSMKSRIRYSETDANLNLTPEGVIDYFQDCSCFQSEDLGVGIQYLENLKLVWLISSWQIVINRYPKLGEKITCSTKPYEFRGCFGFRNFLMMDELGEVLAYANTQFSLVSTKNYMPKIPTKQMIEKYPIEERLEMEYAPRKITVPNNGEYRTSVVIKNQHLDSNKHVNNGQYIRFAFETLENKDQLIEEQVIQIRAQYKKAAVFGDILYPRVINGENVVIISLEDAEGSPYAIIELKGKV